MNMQTQIDLFPLGTCYYSQILISLQIPPVPTASSPLPPWARTLAPRGAWGPRMDVSRKRGMQGPRERPAKGRPAPGQEECEGGQRLELFIFSPAGS